MKKGDLNLFRNEEIMGKLEILQQICNNFSNIMSNLMLLV